MYGFVYIWRDKKHNRFYIGSHWGTIDDGYVCSSTWMKRSYLRRPGDFKRKIISMVYTSKYDLLTEEHKWLSCIKNEEMGTRYYNLTNHLNGHWMTDSNKSLSVKQKISNAKRKFWDSDESNIMREHLSIKSKENGSKPPSRAGKIPWNKGLTKDTDPRVNALSMAVSKPKRKHAKPKSEATKQLARENMKRIWAERKEGT